jgi:predicted flap endonuclease-1-like 5' DNA nuclease
MDKISDHKFCRSACMGVAALVGLCAMWALISLGSWSFLLALFAGAVIWAVVSALLLHFICGGVRETEVQAQTHVEEKKQAKRDESTAVKAAPSSVPAAAPKKNAPVAKAAPPAKTTEPKSTEPKSAALAATPASKAPTAPAAVEATPREGTRPEALIAARGGKADDLKQIKGIGPKMEKLCNSLGFYHFDQIGGWSADEVVWVDQNLQGFKGRVTRDTWVEQAKTLAAGGETEFSKRVEGGDVY